MKGRNRSDSYFYPDPEAGHPPIAVGEGLVEEWNVDDIQDALAMRRKLWWRLGYVATRFVQLNKYLAKYVASIIRSRTEASASSSRV